MSQGGGGGLRAWRRVDHRRSYTGRWLRVAANGVRHGLGGGGGGGRGGGPLKGGPQCRMSILRNGNVACLCPLFSSMSHVKFKK